MFEKVNKFHPDKIADRIAGALVDLAYANQENPKVAIEVLIGHGECHIMAETSYQFTLEEVAPIVNRITEDPYIQIELNVYPQDSHLANNQKNEIRCGDNGIFKGSPITAEQKELVEICNNITNKFPYDGKYILDNNKLTICQSNAKSEELLKLYPDAIINPIGDWTGGLNVDCGATNRKLGSDMGDSITGGGLHGKDLSKADVSINIYCFLLAQKLQLEVVSSCSIGDTEIKFSSIDYGWVIRKIRPISTISYTEIVEEAKNYIKSIGGFEKFAEYGLIR